MFYWIILLCSSFSLILSALQSFLLLKFCRNFRQSEITTLKFYNINYRKVKETTCDQGMNIKPKLDFWYCCTLEGSGDHLAPTPLYPRNPETHHINNSALFLKIWYLIREKVTWPFSKRWFFHTQLLVVLGKKLKYQVVRAVALYDVIAVFMSLA